MKKQLVSYAIIYGKSSMVKLRNVILIFFSVCYLSSAQPSQVVEWQKNYIASGADFITSWLETSDGYLIGGNSDSPAGGMKTSNSRGGFDYWVIKINKSGDKVWDNTYGGTSVDELVKIVKATDGFYLLGTSDSPVGSEKSEPSRGVKDFWIIKINGTGQKVWDKTIGGAQDDELKDVVVLADNSLIIGGASKSDISGDKTSPAKSISTYANDYWVVKLSSSGAKLWDKAYGGTIFNGIGGGDELNTIVSTADGGFLLGGTSNSYNGLDKTSGIDTGATIQNQNWIVKINSLGNKIWDKSFQSTIGQSIIKTPDNGFIIAGTYSVYLNSEEWYENYNNFVKLIKINAQGTVVWDKSYGPIDGIEIGPIVASITARPEGLAVLHMAPQYDSYASVILFNFDGNYQNDFKFYTSGIPFVKSTASGDIVFGFSYLSEGSDGWNYSVSKYKKVTSSQLVDLKLQPSGKGVIISVNPGYINPDVTKVKFYVDGVEKGEDSSYPYSYNISALSNGDHTVQAKAIGSSGTTYSSAIINWRTFEFIGSQAEWGYTPVSDVGNYPITEVNAVTLNGGSSARLWDIGDKVKYTFSVSNALFKIKVRLRSGLYALNSTYSNPTAYFTDGYTFTVNGTTVKFTGDPASVSPKDPSYGGSYWGTMTSDPIALNSFNNIFEILSNKQFLGVDYFEIIPVTSGRMEAELAYQIGNDVGSRPIGTEEYSTLSAGSSAKIWDAGDQIFINFYTAGGNYKLEARVRTGGHAGLYNQPTGYWPNGYSFQVDNNVTTFTGDASTLSGKDPSYGGSYWGTMKSGQVYLAPGYHSLYITSKKEWAGVDYIEIIPVDSAASSLSRLAIGETPEKNQVVHPNPFTDYLTISLEKETTGPAFISLSDLFGKVYLKESKELKGEKELGLRLTGAGVKPGVYLLNVKTPNTNKSYRVVKE